MRTLIITAAYGYTEEHLRPLLVSARESVPETEIVVFSNKGSPGFARRIEALNPRARVLVPRDAAIRNRLWFHPRHAIPFIAGAGCALNLFSRHSGKSPWSRLRTALLHVVCARFIWAESFLDQQHTKFDYIALTDARDVVFQADPFEDRPQHFICGQEPKKLRDCHYNFKWARHLYGKEEWIDRVFDKPILCAGVTLGDNDAIRTYIRALICELGKYQRRVSGWIGPDQAILNKLLYQDKLMDFDAAQNGDSLLATLHHSALDEFEFSEIDGLMTKDGELVKIIHQYDRNQALLKWVSQRFS